MKKTEAIEIVEQTFDKSFDEFQFQRFIKNLLNDYKITDKTVQGEYIRHAFHDFVVKYKIHGEYIDPEGKQLHILQIILKQGSTLLRARTAQRNFVADYLKTRGLDSALVAFVAPKEEDWRFSLVKLEYSLTSEEGKIKTKENLTPAKRWSFLVGKNEGSHTAQSRFATLLVDSEKPTISELEKAFDVEKVTNEFFEKYKDLYFRFKENVDNLIKEDPNLKLDFESKDINSVDFAKKTLGQIVFLYFLQKKGWFGVAHDKNWGDGPKQFIRALYDKRQSYGNNFFNDILEPLFYEALATDRGSKAIYPRLNNTRMPFLNGGLFEPINDYNWEVTSINVPDELFSNSNKTKEGDIGDGILDIFDRYNFTVNENDPLEKEVAVDPEMLGKVFENLLEIKERKDKGSFYTPREIVHYMCRESIINYLENETKNEISHEDLETLVYKGASIIENDSLALEKIKEKEKKGFAYTGSLKLMIPKSIQENAEGLDILLKDIKVADPAVGSGAFPLGMINEIVSARKTLGIYTKSNESAYDIKLHAISNSIHGVDIDPGAVEIAKLRLWLSLVVEEIEPHPLPNLDHRIMQGNSLLSEYEGIQLFDPSFLNQDDTSGNEIAEIEKQISALQQEYFRLHQNRSLNPIKKKDIEEKIKVLQKRQHSLKHDDTEVSKNRSLFDRNERYEILTEKTNLLQKRIEQYVSESRKTHKEELKKEIDELKWELIEESLKDQGKLDKLEKVKELRHKNFKPFFLWELEFSEVFKNKGGFDIVIGNPPYIQLQKNGGELADLFEVCGYQSFTRTGDIYCLFYELGNQILHNKGHLVFITSNKWMRANYGEKLRKFLIEFTTPKILLDLGPGVFETATVDTNILLFQKDKVNKKCIACVVKENLAKRGLHIKDYIQKNSVELNQITGQSWIILNARELKIKNKIESIGKPLKDWDVKISYGIKTGYNKAFIIDGRKKEELISKDPKSAEIIKKILRGKDIQRYYSNFAGLWLITSHNGYRRDSGEKVEAINIEDYTAVKEWLDSHWKDILKRDDQGKTPYNLRNCAYQEEFMKEKIIWQEMVQAGSFLFDDNGYFCNDTGRIMTGNDIKYLLPILNSKLFFFAIKNFYGGGGLGSKGVRMKHTFFENFHVPEIMHQFKIQFVDLVDQISEITMGNGYDPKQPTVRQKELEKQIDQMVYELYRLNEEEIRIVEDSYNN